MGWQPGNDRRRPPPVLLGVLWIAVVALVVAGCSKGEAKGEAASTAGLPVYKASVQKFKYSGMPTSIKAGESIITLTNRESGEIAHEFVLLALPSGKSASDIVVMGEKVWTYPDYYMNFVSAIKFDDYFTRVDMWKHGQRFGSNYLFLDMHVNTLPEKLAISGADPWDFPDPDVIDVPKK